MRRGEQMSQAFQAPVDVHASADGQVYMFNRRPNESTASSDDEALNVMEMRPRVFQDQEQDSLRSVQEEHPAAGARGGRYKAGEQPYARTRFICLEIYQNTRSETQLSNRDVHRTSDPRQETPHSSTALVKPQDRARAQPHLQEVTDFLMEVDHDIEKLIQTTNDQDGDFSANSGKQQRFGFRGRRLTGPGADWGIQWWNAVVAMLLIGIVLPLFYVIYFKTKDNGAVNDGGASELSNASSNASGTGLDTRGPEHFQEPG